MQKQKINYLVLQSDYQQITVALFSDNQMLAQTQISKFIASSKLINTIKASLEKHSFSLTELAFICANLGPAPFTTLRTTIVTVNGLSYAKKIPLVGVNGLTVFAKEALPELNNLIIILNAYGHSVYYATRKGLDIAYGWLVVDDFLNKIKTDFKQEPVTIIGEGIANFYNELSQLTANFVINQEHAGYPDISLIAQAGLTLFKAQNTSDALMPLYLKQALIESKLVKI